LIAYKLFTLRADGSIGPLFINKSKRIPFGVWMWSEDHPTPGYAHRPGWHVLPEPYAPHLAERKRVWAKVGIKHFVTIPRPKIQGGEWYLSRRMKVLHLLP